MRRVVLVLVTMARHPAGWRGCKGIINGEPDRGPKAPLTWER